MGVRVEITKSEADLLYRALTIYEVNCLRNDDDVPLDTILEQVEELNQIHILRIKFHNIANQKI